MFICAGIKACACFLLFSPAEELSFGSVETERKSLIILSNVAKNQVAFKVSLPELLRHGRWTRVTLLQTLSRDLRVERRGLALSECCSTPCR